MTWIRLPIAWQVGSRSMLLASIGIHGVLLVIPLADRKETPKPDILGAVPITALPAEPTVASATELPVPAQTLQSPPPPEDPSIEESKPLFDRFPDQNWSSFPDRSTSFPKQPEEPIETIETVEETATERTEFEESSEPSETSSQETEETRVETQKVETQNEGIIPERPVESPPSPDPRKKIRLTSTHPSSTSEDSEEGEEIDRTFSQGNDTVESLFASLEKDDKGILSKGEQDILDLLKYDDFFPNLSQLKNLLVEQNTLKPAIEKNQSLFILSSTKSPIDSQKLREYYIAPLANQGFTIEEPTTLYESQVYPVKKNKFVRYIQLYETEYGEDQILAGVIVWKEPPAP